LIAIVCGVEDNNDGAAARDGKPCEST
jgi:hypothetical protein